MLPFVFQSSAEPFCTSLDGSEGPTTPFEGRLGPAGLKEEAESTAKWGGGALPLHDLFITTTAETKCDEVACVSGGGVVLGRVLEEGSS